MAWKLEPGLRLAIKVILEFRRQYPISRDHPGLTHLKGRGI